MRRPGSITNIIASFQLDEKNVDVNMRLRRAVKWTVDCGLKCSFVCSVCLRYTDLNVEAVDITTTQEDIVGELEGHSRHSQLDSEFEYDDMTYYKMNVYDE